MRRNSLRQSNSSWIDVGSWTPRRHKRLPGSLPGIVLLSLLLFASCQPVADSSDLTFVESLPSGPTLESVDVPVGVRPRFERIGIKEGLSQNTVFCILQDSRGYMWFGTEHGLNRYDGYEFTIYRSEPGNPGSIADSWITALAEDSRGLVWVGTLTGGLWRYDRRTDQFSGYLHDDSNPRSISSNEVTSALVDTSGDLWIGTKSGLNRYDSNDDAFDHFNHDASESGSLSDNHVLSLAEDLHSVIWVGTHDGCVNRFDSSSGTFTSFAPEGYSSAELNGALSLVVDPDGVVWIGTEMGLFRLNPGDSDPKVLPVEIDAIRVRSLFWNVDGTLLVGTQGRGLLVLEPDELISRSHRHIPADVKSISSDAIESIYRDKEETLWFGTLPGGINKLSVDARSFTHFEHIPGEEDSLGENWVRSVFEDPDGMIWVGTGTRGVSRYDPAGEMWTHYRHDDDDPASIGANYVSLISRHESGRLFIPTVLGLDVFDLETGIFTHFMHDPSDPDSLAENDFVWAVLCDSVGTIWVATQGGGLNRFDIETGNFIAYKHDPLDPTSLSHDGVWNIFEDRRGRLWVGTTNGLDKFDRATGLFKRYRSDPADPSTLSHDFIGSVVEDDAGRLWVGTVGGGINRFDPDTGSTVRTTAACGLPSNAIMAMIKDEYGKIWVSTSNGLAKLDPDTGMVEALDASDGVPLDEFNGGAATRLASGNMAFGAVGGLIEFKPRHIQKNRYVPPIVITRISVDGTRTERVDEPTRQKLTIRWPDNSFEFEFAALSYVNPQMNRYAYKLEGLDTEWTLSGTVRAGIYRRLPGGTYTLRVIGSNDDGIWNTTGATLSVTVIPPFWATWWFRSLAALAVVASLFAAYSIRIRTVAERAAKLQHEVAAERGRLARELHDSVTQSLYSLTLFIEASREFVATGEYDQADRGLERSGTTALQALKELRLLVYELRPLALKEMGLVGAIQDRLNAVEKRAGVQTAFIVDISPGSVIPDEVEEALFRIAQEALNNALKHAHASSITVRVEVSATGASELEISDNGSGFDPAHAAVHGGMGLRNIRDRADKIGWRCDITTIPGTGTRISILQENE